MSNKKNVKSLLICNSNLFIPTVLTEVLSHPQEHYLIISDIENIHRFFNFLVLTNIDYVEYGIKGHFDFIKEKRKLFSKVIHYNIGRVVFFHAEYGDMANWLIMKLSKTIPICYCKIYDSIPAHHSRKLWKTLKIKLREWIYWGIDMDVLDHTSVFPSIPQKFYNSVKASIVTMPVDMTLVTRYVASKIKDENLYADYVLLTGTVVATGKADAITYERLTNNIIDVFGIEKTVSKCHPRFKDLYGKEKELKQIPAYIPGNVLIENYACYVGFESTLLVEAAIAGKKSISLIDMLPLSVEARQSIHVFFTSRLQGKGQILYPQSLEELEAFI